MGTDNLFWKKKNRSIERKSKNRNSLQSFLIVCEGGKTEPNYFQAFRLKSAKVTVMGQGYNTDSLIKYALKLKKKAAANHEEYDQVWCVFDRDSFPLQNFNAAMKLAKQKNIRAAYSNEAFELWYLLHFDYIDAGISRESYKQRLSKYIGHSYKKNSKTMYKELLDKQEKAIKNAERLLKSYPTPNPANDNPSTTVHKLVTELNKFLPKNKSV